MNFQLLDGYLLQGTPPKAKVVKALLAERSEAPAAAAFYQGIEMLGPRTPDLTLIALRLVLAGKPATDQSVVHLREIIERTRGEGTDAQAALQAYHQALAP